MQVGVNEYQTSFIMNGVTKVEFSSVPLMFTPLIVKAVALPHKSFAGASAGMLKVFEINVPNVGAEKVKVAPVTAAALVAVNPLNVTTPFIAVAVNVPPSVHVA